MGKKITTYRQNPNIDFLFGYFGNMAVPTKQGGYKPIEMIETREDGTEIILNDFYIKKPDTNAIVEFKKYIQVVARKNFNESNIIKMPNDVQVHMSISVNKKRYYEVDVDNLAKTVLDCIKGIAFDDDSQVSSLIVEKHIHPMNVNGILIAITKITDDRKGLTFSW
jgi:Holliday junction resolvase RusA-like endonuclease